MSDLQAENEARLRQTKAQVEEETQKLQRLNEDAMRMRKLRGLEETVERAILEAKLIKDIDETLASPLQETPQEYRDKPLHTSCRDNQPLSSETSPTVSQPLIERASSQADNLSALTGSNVIPSTITITGQRTSMQLVSTSPPVKELLANSSTVTTLTSSISTPLISNASLSSPKEMTTSVTRNSPWRGWHVPGKVASSTPRVHGTAVKKHQVMWGLIPAFPGPPQDAWIEELDEFSAIPLPQFMSHQHCSFSALERSLPKFELGKFDGSPLDWPSWIGRIKSIVHDQPFLNNNQRLTYLQNNVTGSAKSEIQLLGEDGGNYILALRMLKVRFVDPGKIVRAAIVTLRDTPPPHLQGHGGLAMLHQTLRSTIATLHRQRFITDPLSETNLSIAVEKLPDDLASKWTMEVQKHEGQGRPNLFDLD